MRWTAAGLQKLSKPAAHPRSSKSAAKKIRFVLLVILIPFSLGLGRMRTKSKKKQPEFDELYLLRLDASGRPRGARFVKLKDDVASAAVDMKCRALIHQPKAVCRLAMELPEGRLYRGMLVMPRIRRGLFDKILDAARIAARNEKTKMEAAAVKESAYIKALIDEANSAIAEGRKMRRVRR
jgi:hypothetical protein